MHLVPRALEDVGSVRPSAPPPRAQERRSQVAGLTLVNERQLAPSNELLARLTWEPAPRQLHSTQCNPHEGVARNIVLIILWLLGLVTSYTMSGFVHVLIVIAVVLILVRLVSGRSWRLGSSR